MKNLGRYLNLIVIFGFLISCTHSQISESIEDKISFLVENTVKSKKDERLAFQELQLLGRQAVPYIIGHQGDMRLLAEQEISLKNYSPDQFEAIGHYSPQTVHDALSAILNQITGQHFVFVYNGSSLQERIENINHWVAWCKLEYPEQIHVCDTTKTNNKAID